MSPAREQTLDSPALVEQARRRVTAPRGQHSLARVQKALCEPARVKIVHALTAGPLSVKDLAAVIGRTSAATSQHLRVLREAGVVQRTRRGTSMLYRLHPGVAGQEVRDVLQSMGFDVGQGS